MYGMAVFPSTARPFSTSVSKRSAAAVLQVEGVEVVG